MSGGGSMHKVTIDSTGLDEGLAAFVHAWKAGEAEEGSRISFADPDLLWTVLTAKRWALLKLLAGKEPMSLRAVTRRTRADRLPVRRGACGFSSESSVSVWCWSPLPPGAKGA